MTYREIVQRAYPDCCGDQYESGVCGCPGNYFKGAAIVMNGECNLHSLDDTAAKDDCIAACAACWDQECKETA